MLHLAIVENTCRKFKSARVFGTWSCVCVCLGECVSDFRWHTYLT